MLHCARTLVAAAALLASVTTAQDPIARPRPPAVEVHADGTVTVRGRVVCTELDGKPRARVQGRATVTLWVKEADPTVMSGSTEEAEIADGTFVVTFPAGGAPAALSLDECAIGDAPLVIEPDRIDLVAGVELVFHVRPLPELRLRVTDAHTKKDLEGIEVFRDDDWRRSDAIHPGLGADLERLVEGAKSPALVPAKVAHGAKTARLWVRAPGYAWQPLEVFVTKGGTREVTLVRGGSLAVTVRGVLPEAQALVALRLYRERADGAPAVELAPDAGGTTSLDGLVPGRYVVRVEQGEWFRSPRVLGAAEAVVAAGTTTKVELKAELDVKTEAAPGRVAVRGTLVVPPQWLAEPGQRVSLTLEPLGRAERWGQERLHVLGDDLVPGDQEGEFRFALADIVIGRYQLIASPGQYRRLLSVRAGGITDLRIELPPPAEVVLRVTDAGTKAPRHGVRVHWYTPLPAGVNGWSPESATAAADSNEVRFLAPVGTITLEGSGDTYSIERRNLEISPGKNEFDVAAQPVFGVTVALYEGDTRIPVGSDSGWRASLEPVEGRADSHAWRGADTPIVTKAGRYVLRVEAPPGYQPVPDRQVALGPGPFPTIDIKVAREQ